MVVLRRLIPALRSSSSSSIDDCEPPSTSRLPVARQYSHDSGYAEYIVEDGPKAPTDASPAPRRSALGWRAKLAVLKRKEKAQYEPTPFLRALGTQYAPSSAGVEGGGTRSAARSAWEAKVRALEGAARKESGRARERGWLSVREEEREQWWRRHTEEEGR
ncbi:hypothetical protein JCM10450v2_004436 [Rhodotorula kratochvilovae]